MPAKRNSGILADIPETTFYTGSIPNVKCSPQKSLLHLINSKRLASHFPFKIMA